MKLVKYVSAARKETLGVLEGERIAPLEMPGDQYQTLFDILESESPAATVEFLLSPDVPRVPLDSITLLPPIDRQEVWAAGVTYKRSQVARMEESEQAASVYDLVYKADRPELFFKATPNRVVGPGAAVRIRRDAKWSVPEPELALVLNSRLQLVGCTIGNDMSSRDIEGQNPLYLPQAKLYDQCCALGPCVTLVNSMPPREQLEIRLAVLRGGEIVFEGHTRVGEMARSFEDLIRYLGRDQTFRDGVILLTGTGIVPDESFTLSPGDTIDIAIDGIGALQNTVVQG